MSAKVRASGAPSGTPSAKGRTRFQHPRAFSDERNSGEAVYAPNSRKARDLSTQGLHRNGAALAHTARRN